MKKSSLILGVALVAFIFSLYASEGRAAEFKYVNNKVDNMAKVPVIAGVNADMNKSEFWIGKLQLPNEIILSANDIVKINMDTYKKFADNTDMFEKPIVIQGAVIKKWIEQYEPVKKESIDQAMNSNIQLMLANRDVESLKDEVIPQLGFTVRKSDMRSFPISDKYFTEPERLIDRYQETRLDPSEAIIILHTSKDKNWYFVQSSNYRGWIPANDVAFSANSISWTAVVQNSKFLVVTSSNMTINKEDGKNSEKLVYEMGAKIPLLEVSKKYYLAQVPTKDKNNQVVWKNVKIPKNAPVSEGYLPFTRANIIRQAFEFYGQKYGWGGMFDSVDCSSLAMNVYKTMGLMIPRNSSEQMEMDVPKVEFSGDEKARLKDMAKLMPGDQIFSPGHVMLYLGEDNGEYYMIHAFTTAGDISKPLGDNTYEMIMANCVAVTPVKLINTEGVTFLNKFISANQIGSR